MPASTLIAPAAALAAFTAFACALMWAQLQTRHVRPRNFGKRVLALE